MADGPLTEAAASEEVDEHDWLFKRHQQVVDQVDISIRYHRIRERFFDNLDRWSKGLTVVSGSAALLRVFGEDLTRLALFAATLLSTISLTFGLADRSRKHGQLAQQFATLRARIAEKGERDYDEADINAWDAACMKLEVDEPRPLPVVQALAQSQHYRATGRRPIQIHPIRRFFGHVFAIEP